jgi:phospholipid/cholesterol/gamma-HCH transport system substrate-binding protein
VTSRLHRTAIGLLTIALVPLVGCGRSGGSYHLTAYFDRTIGLYESGDVQVMGMAVGRVDSIEIDGTLVRVEMTIDDDVPLPADVRATIGQTQLIGERNVVLFPPWDAEQEAADAARIGDGDVIPRERTEVPVEPDEGLQAFNDLAESLDGDVVRQFVSDSADVLEGRGDRIGAAIDQAAGLGTALAEIDQQLVDAADNLHVLAGSLATRDEQLGALVDDFAQASEVLAAERDGIRSFLSSLVELTAQGRGLLDAYGEQLPGDIAAATALASILERNTSSLDQLLSAFPQLAIGVANAYQPAIDGLYLRANASASAQALLDVLVNQLGVLP